MYKRYRAGFTLVELLVVIAIIGILMGMTLPAIQGLREASRRAACSQNLTRISVGLSEYSLVNGAYPAGSINPDGPIKNVADGFHHNWTSALLTTIDYDVVYRAMNHDISVYEGTNAEVMKQVVPTFSCPSASVSTGTSCYAGLHHPSETPIDEDNWGAFILNRQLSEDDFPDGISATLFISEKLEDYRPLLGWISGTRATLRNSGHPINAITSLQEVKPPGEVSELYVGGLASSHAVGVNALFGDGATRFTSETIDTILLAQLVDRRDGGIGAVAETGGGL